MIQVNRVEPSAVRNTKDIDIMIYRADPDRVTEATKAANAVHLIVSGENNNPKQTIPNPPLRPEHISVHGVRRSGGPRP